jgi:hypothetical protein
MGNKNVEIKLFLSRDIVHCFSLLKEVGKEYGKKQVKGMKQIKDRKKVVRNEDTKRIILH